MSVTFRVIEHGVVDSTSERAFAALERGEARHGDVHVAIAQTAGRGRRGAQWHSAGGAGLYMSVVWMPGPPPLHPAALTMAAGLAVHGALRELGLERVALKWPNDVVVARGEPRRGAREAAKIAGILVETRGLDARRPHCVIGIGVNVRQRAFEPELRAQRPVTSLALEGVEADIDTVREAVLRELGLELERARDRTDALAERFARATGLLDQRATVEGPDGELVGRVLALSIGGGLALELDDGSRAALPLEHVRRLSAIDG
jgi:BirA family biotin operon repressor/biotin-[acetyl-CoA-carboxylase] ligase